jgi:hypothetical protein
MTARAYSLDSASTADSYVERARANELVLRVSCVEEASSDGTARSWC